MVKVVHKVLDAQYVQLDQAQDRLQAVLRDKCKVTYGVA